jgi:hypothetical protein
MLEMVRWCRPKSLFLRSLDGREVRVVRVTHEALQTQRRLYEVEWPGQHIPQRVNTWEAFDNTMWYVYKRRLPWWGPERYQVMKLVSYSEANHQWIPIVGVER